VVPPRSIYWHCIVRHVHTRSLNCASAYLLCSCTCLGEQAAPSMRPANTPPACADPTGCDPTTIVSRMGGLSAGRLVANGRIALAFIYCWRARLHRLHLPPGVPRQPRLLRPEWERWRRVRHPLPLPSHTLCNCWCCIPPSNLYLTTALAWRDTRIMYLFIPACCILCLTLSTGWPVLTQDLTPILAYVYVAVNTS